MEKFWPVAEIKQIHIELTNACNAACPICPRYYKNSLNVRPDLEITQIRLDAFKKYFPKEILSNLDCIMFCGVHGDPILATDLLEICKYVIESSPKILIIIHTNGGIREESWWANFGRLFNNSKSHFVFGIDGLEDTNHLYRRNVDWKTLMRNVRAYIDNGGNAIWDYLIFRHNEHQIEEAKKISKEFGFEEFRLKKALGLDINGKLKKLPALDEKGKVDYFIEPPLKKEYRNFQGSDEFANQEEGSLNAQEYDMEEYVREKKEKITNEIYTDTIPLMDITDNRVIKCKSKMFNGKKEIFVDCLGRVMPCCFVGTSMNSPPLDPAGAQLHQSYNKYGKDSFDLNKTSLEDILNKGHLENLYTSSWNKKTIKEGKLLYCIETCGVDSSVGRIRFD